MSPASPSPSPYARFERPVWLEDPPIEPLEYHGVPVYENEHQGLFHTIIKRSDIEMMNQLLAKHPPTNWQSDISLYDPFLWAAEYGSTDVLRMLLESCASRQDLSEVVHANGRFLLWEACNQAQVDTARFLLDNEPHFRKAHSGIGNIHTVSCDGYTALLSAANSFTTWNDGEKIHDIREHLARSEQLMAMLLDRGASAQDRFSRVTPGPTVAPKVPIEDIADQTVLSLAISQASAGLVKRLIDGGANVHITTRAPFFHPPYAFGSRETFWGITPLHIGSHYLNVEGVQQLLDDQGDKTSMNIVSCRDNHGCLPLHWAASGSYTMEEYYMSSGRDIALRRINIFKLLLGPDPASINARDNQGETVLSWATRNHGVSYSTHLDVVKFLCNNGANAGIQDKSGRNALHWLGYPREGNKPIDTNIIDLLLTYGANVNDTDQEGNTPLHHIANCAYQTNAVKFLISRGADPSARNLKGDTPLHRAAEARGFSIYTEEDRIRAMKDTVRVLEQAGSDSSTMYQPNVAGKTPRQICDESRGIWEEETRRRLLWEARVKSGFGRGSGKARKPT
jgi:ankyrin repeat protein